MPPGALDHYVKLEFKLLNWKYMNFTMKFREDTHIFSIKKLLRERHGRMDDLKLCFNSFSEANEINDEMLTLLEYGLKGVQPEVKVDEEGHLIVSEDNIPTIQVFYDFKPPNSDDAILLHFK